MLWDLVKFLCYGVFYYQRNYGGVWKLIIIMRQYFMVHFNVSLNIYIVRASRILKLEAAICQYYIRYYNIILTRYYIIFSTSCLTWWWVMMQSKMLLHQLARGKKLTSSFFTASHRNANRLASFLLVGCNWPRPKPI